jgi:CubicO group peptidase (beta-lactamase class C family)
VHVEALGTKAVGGADRMRRNSIFRIASITKPITAAAARLLSRPSIELMTTDHLTERQRADSAIFFGGNRGWGFGMAVYTQRDDLSAVPGRFGWDGGYGTSAYVDPNEGLIGILLTQKMMDSPEAPPVYKDFWTSAYSAIDD